MLSGVVVAILLSALGSTILAITGKQDADTFWQSYRAVITAQISIPVWLLVAVAICIALLVRYIAIYDKNKRIEKTVCYHSSPYITFKDNPKSYYCANCWTLNHTRTQLPVFFTNTFECPKCKTTGCYETE